MRKRHNIDKKWLEKCDAPLLFREWFESELNLIVKIEGLVGALHTFGKSDWEGWLLSQEIDVTEVAIEYGANISVCDSLALRIVAQNDRLELMKYLVKKSVNLHIFNDLLLILAAERGHLRMVSYLLSKGLDIHTQKDCALRWAIKKNNLELVKFLVGEGASINDACDEDTLKLVEQKKYVEILSFLGEQKD